MSTDELTATGAVEVRPGLSDMSVTVDSYEDEGAVKINVHSEAVSASLVLSPEEAEVLGVDLEDAAERARTTE
jgi:hypothetical protein